MLLNYDTRRQQVFASSLHDPNFIYAVLIKYVKLTTFITKFANYSAISF